MGVPDSTTNGTAGSKPQVPSHFIGGNHLEAAAPSAVRDFVAKNEGHSVISSVRTPSFHPYFYTVITSANGTRF